MEIKKKTDKRVIRTKHAIHGAFTKLLAEKDLNDITVKDIAECANINRKTFYNYYSGIYQVVEEIESGLVNRFDDTFSDLDFKECINEPRLIFDRLNSLICADLEFYGNLFSMNENLDIISKMTSLIKAKTKKTICSQTGIDEERADIALEFAISGMISVYQMWFRSGRTKPLNEVTDIIGKMCFEGFKGIVI